YAVVGHPKRAKQASELAHALDAEVAMDNGRGSNANHDAAWALYDPWAEWHVVVEDDAVLTSGFLQQAAAALAAAPGDGAVSFYLGNSRPKPTEAPAAVRDRKSTRLNSSHVKISYAVFCLKKKNKHN